MATPTNFQNYQIAMAKEAEGKAKSNSKIEFG
jgi:hypothetical protein